MKNKQSSLSKMRSVEQTAAYLFISPYLIMTIVFTIGMILFALYISLHTWNIFQRPEFVGLANYIKAFKSEDFWRGFLNITWYTVLVVFFQTFIAVFMAVILFKPIPGKQFFRTFFYAPSVTSSVVISMIFWWLYLKTGYINLFMSNIAKVFGGEWSSVEWLNNPTGLFQLIARAFGGDIPFTQWYFHGPSVTWMALMVQAVYTTSPTFMIMFLAALVNIPPSLYESASIDGATQWKQFWKITLPMLRPIMLLVVVLGTMGCIQMFDYVKIMTAGGPLGTTMTPVYQIYTETLGTNGPIRAGYGAAMAFILAVVIFVFTYIQRKFIEEKTELY
ncbi:MAG: sugar ABC transporter permease [Bacteroidetes bacterium]|nr:sugar ABC transporter permease [Bacteroidota bacterium]